MQDSSAPPIHLSRSDSHPTPKGKTNLRDEVCTRTPIEKCHKGAKRFTGLCSFDIPSRLLLHPEGDLRDGEPTADVSSFCRPPGHHPASTPHSSPPLPWGLRSQAPLTFIAFLTDPRPITPILDHVGEPTSPPLIHPARGPSQTELAMGPHGGTTTRSPRNSPPTTSTRPPSSIPPTPSRFRKTTSTRAAVPDP